LLDGAVVVEVLDPVFRSKRKPQDLSEESLRVLEKVNTWKKILEKVEDEAVADYKLEMAVPMGMAYSAFAVVILDRPGNSRHAVEGSYCTVVAD